MVRECAFLNCANKMRSYSKRTFLRLLLLDPERLQLWLVVLQMDPNTLADTLHQADYPVCSDHFHPDDYCKPSRYNPDPKHITPEEKCGSKSGDVTGRAVPV